MKDVKVLQRLTNGAISGDAGITGRRRLFQTLKAKFVEAYIANGGNATEAAKTAGYSERSAYARGGELVKDREVSAAIAERSKLLAKKYELTTDLVQLVCRMMRSPLLSRCKIVGDLSVCISSNRNNLCQFTCIVDRSPNGRCLEQ